MTEAAVGAVGHVFREGFKYSKTEVLPLGLCHKGEYTDDLFAASQLRSQWLPRGRWGSWTLLTDGGGVAP